MNHRVYALSGKEGKWSPTPDAAYEEGASMSIIRVVSAASVPSCDIDANFDGL
jgi:hypothetical protein